MSKRWQILLIASLSLNLLLGAMFITRYFTPEMPERMASTSYLNLIPRKFLSDLGKPRREELLAGLKTQREQYRDGQKTARASALSLADALAANDDAQLRAVLDGITANGAGMITLSSGATLDFIAKLTPAERAQLADRIRARASWGRKK